MKHAKLILLWLESVRVRAKRLAGARRHIFISRRRPSNASLRSVLTLSKGGSGAGGAKAVREGHRVNHGRCLYPVVEVEAREKIA